jgi:outer membrane immunogenic protein
VALGGANIEFDGLGGEGLLASAYGGLDFQFGSGFVVGIMADGTWSNIETTLNATAGGAALNASVRADVAWSVLGRLGYVATPSTLWYVGAGYTWQNFRSRLNAPGIAATRDDNLDGLTLVSGVETMLVGNLSAKLEYRYSFFEEANFFGGALGIKPTMHTVRAGLSYKFNWGSAPVSASY